MQNIDKQQIRNNYEMKFMCLVNELTLKRKKLRINQSRMAYYAGVSLKTIQNFENFECYDYYFIHVYREVFKIITKKENIIFLY